MTTVKRAIFLRATLAILIACFVSSCNQSKISIDSIKKKVSNDGGSTAKSITVSNVDVTNNQLVIDGVNLDTATSVRVTGPAGFDETFAIESQSNSQLIANSLSNLTMVVNGLFSLIVSNAHGAATYTLTFELQDGQVTAAKLNNMGAVAGEVLTYNGTSWGPAPLTGLSYQGTFDATGGDQTSGAAAAGHYYIVTNAGSNDPDGLNNGNTYTVGDWAVYNGSTSQWDVVIGSNAVVSVAGKVGAVTLSWADFSKAGSLLSEISNVDVSGRVDGDILVWNNTTSNWEVGQRTTDTNTNAITECGAGQVLLGDGSCSTYVADTNASTICADGQYLDGDGTCYAVPVDTNTTYTNGTGLLLSGTTFSVDVGTGANQIVRLDGSGALPAVDGSALTNISASSIAVQNITSGVGNYFGYQPNGGACNNGEVLEWNGAQGWVCGTKTVDNDTTYSAGAGLNLAGTTFSIPAQGVTNTMVNGVTANCSSGEVLKANGTGGFSCATDVGGAGDADANKLQGENLDSALATNTTTDGQILVWSETNGQWQVGTLPADSDTTYTAGAGLALTGTIFSVNPDTTTTLGTSDTEVPSQNAVKTYVDAQVGAINESQWITSGSDIYYNTGVVGVGTTTPTAGYVLDAAGDVFIQGNIRRSLDTGVDMADGDINIRVNNRSALRGTRAGAVAVTIGDSLDATGTVTVKNDSTFEKNVEVKGTDVSNTLSIVNESSTSARIPSFKVQNYTGGNGGYPAIDLTNARGSSGTPAATNAADPAGLFQFWGHDGTAAQRIGSIGAYTEATTSGTSAPGFLQFNTTSTSSVVPSEKMRITGAGNVGINETTPNEKLTIDGVISIREGAAPTASGNYGKIYVDSTDSKLYFVDDAGTSFDLTATGTGADNLGNHTATQNIDLGTSLLVGNGGSAGVAINASGNVGVGTTNPLSPLHVSGGGRFVGSDLLIYRTNAGGSQVKAFLNLNAPTTGTRLGSFALGDGNEENVELNAVATETHAIGTNYGTAFLIKTTENATTTAVERLRVDHNGKVGIGTTTPAVELDVNTGVINAASICDENNANCLDLSAGITSGDVSYGSSASSPADAVYVNDSGFVGVGTTAPVVPLQVNGDIALSNEIFFDSSPNDLTNAAKIIGGANLLNIAQCTNADCSSGQNFMTFKPTEVYTTLNFGLDDFTPDAPFELSSNGITGSTPLFMISSNDDTDGDYVTITKDGKVGLGTKTPSENLVVGDDFGVDYTGKRLVVGDTTGYPGVIVGNDDNNRAWQIWDVVNDVYYFGTRVAGADYNNTLVLDAGKVGIGTASPAVALDVDTGVVNASAICDENNANCIDLSAGVTGGDASYGSSASSPSDAVYVNDTGFVGIGTTTPGVALHIKSTEGLRVERTGSAGFLQLESDVANPTGSSVGLLDFIGLDSAANRTAYSSIIGGAESHTDTAENGFLTLRTSKNGTMTERVRVTSDGRVGVGTDAPTSLLHLREPDDTWNSSFRMDRSYDSSTDYFQMMYDYEGFKVRTMANGADEAHLIFKPLNVEAMRITQSGNVGIGTSTPAVALDVNTGVINASAICDENNANCLDLSAGVGGSDNLGDHTATQNVSLGTNYISNNGTASQGLVFDGNNRATFRPNGGWGVTLDSGNFRILNTAGSWSTGTGQYLNMGIFGGAARIFSKNGTNAYPMELEASTFKIQNDTTDTFVVNSSGNVGVGTSSPQVPFQVGAGPMIVGGNIGGYSTQGIVVNSSSARSDITFLHSSTGTTQTSDGFNIAQVFNRVELNNRENDDMVFLTNNTEILRLDNGGFVGIENNAPSSKLTIGESIGAGYGVTVQSDTQYGAIVETSQATPSNAAALWVRTTPDGGTTTNTLLRVENNGNVGVGRSPAAKLDVDGTIRAVELCDETGANCKDISTGWAGGGTSEVSFFVHRNAVNQTLPASSTLALVDWTTESYDNGGAFDLTTDRFQPSTAGKYLIIVKARIGSMSDSRSAEIVLRKNGVKIASNTAPSSVTTMSVHPEISYIVEMNGSTDYLDIQAAQSETSTRTLFGGITDSYFAGYLLSSATGAGGLSADSVTSAEIADNSVTGTDIASNTVTIANLDFASTDGINIPQLAADPTGGTAGQTYYNTTTKKMMFYDGTSWLQIDNDIATTNSDTDGDTKIMTEESADEDKIRFDTAGSERMIITETGKVGIGTSSPFEEFVLTRGDQSTSLNIVNSSSTSANFPKLIISNYDGTGLGGFPMFYGLNYRGSSSSPLPVQAGDTLVSYTGAGATNTSYGSAVGATIDFIAHENFSNTVNSGLIAFFTVDPGASSSTEKMRLTSDGRLGIGLPDPSEQLSTEGDGVQSTMGMNTYRNSSSGSKFIFRQSRGSRSVKTASQAGDYSNISFRAYDGSTFGDAAEIRGGSDSTATTGSTPGRLRFYTTPASSTTSLERMQIDSAGNVGIGTTNPTEKLQVNGNDENVTLKITNENSTSALYPGIKLYNYTGGTTGHNWIGQYASGGNNVTPAAVPGNQNVGGFGFYAYDGTAFKDVARIMAGTGSNFTTGDQEGQITFLTGNGTTYTDRMIINAEGNVGIGSSTTNVTGSNTNSTVLTISGDGTLDSADGRIELNNPRASGSLTTSSTAGRIFFTADNNGPSANENIMARIFALLEGSGGANGFGSSLIFHTRGDNTAGGSNERMRINNEGNVGIGTTAPTAKLQVARTGTPTAPMAYFDDNAAAHNNSDVVVEAFRPGYVLRDETTSAHDFRLGLDNNAVLFSFDTNNDESKTANSHYDDQVTMRVQSNGKVAIGGDITPLETLHIYNNAGTEGTNGIFIQDPSAGGTNGGSIYYDDRGGLEGFKVAVSNASTETGYLYFERDSGRVGIGKTSLSSTLDVSGPITFSGLDVSATPANSGVLSHESSLSATRILAVGPNSTTSGQLHLTVSNSVGGGQSNLVLNSVGNVGVGTTGPNARLEVKQSVNTVGGALRTTRSDTTNYVDWYIGGDNMAYVQIDSAGYCRFSSGSAWSCISDERLKEQIEDLDDQTTLEKVTSIRSVNYRMKSDPYSKEKKIGLLAQDVEKFFPELVDNDEDGFRSVQYSGLVSPLISATRELKSRLEDTRNILDLKIIDIQGLHKNIEMFQLMQEGVDKRQDRAIASLQEENNEIKEELDEIKERNRALESKNRELEERLKRLENIILNKKGGRK